MWRKPAAAVSVCILLTGVLVAANPAGYRKPYFGATKPGSWAKYTMSMPNFPDSTSLYTRQADEGGEQRIQIRSDFTNEGQASTSFTNYRLKKGYSLEKNAMDFGKAVVGMSTAVGDGPATEIAADILASVRKAMPDYSSAVKFVKTETVAGKPCDRYSYTIKNPGQVYSGELWFNETVPFGLVRQTGTTKGAKGKVLSQFEMILTDSGSAKTAASTETAKPAPPGPLTLADAFQKEQVELTVEVLPNPKDGSRVRVVFKNKGETPLKLVIPAGATALDVGTPIDTLNLESAAEKTLELAPGKSSLPIDLAQTGDYRPVKGKFAVSVYDGTQLFSGSVTMDHVK